MRGMAPTDVTYFFITDHNGTDRTQPAPQPSTTASSTEVKWKWVKARTPC